MKKFIIVWLTIFLCGCASAMPNLVNGKYYMGGDSSCSRYRALSESRIMCIDKDGNETGYRDAMTDQQLQMYQHNQQMEQQRSLARKQRNKTTTCYTNYGITTCN
jgi:hypothetical protein